MHHLTTCNVQWIRNCGELKYKWTTVSHSLSQRIIWKKDWEDLRLSSSGCLQGNSICQMWQGCCTHELTVDVTECTNLQDQASMDGGRANVLSLLAEELLAIDGCWWEDSQFSSTLWPLRGYPCSRRYPYTHAHTGSTKWTLRLRKEGLYKVGRVNGGKDRGEIVGKGM